MQTTLVLLFFTLLSRACFAQDLQNRQKHISIAKEWLYRLCVVPDGDFEPLSLSDLRKAFDVWSQSTGAARCEPEKFKASSKEPKSPIKVDSSSIRLNVWQQIARVPQFRTVFQQTPDYVYGVLQGAPANTPSQFSPDPDHALLSLGGPLHFDELYVGMDTRVAICTALYDLGQQQGTSGPSKVELDEKCRDPSYLLANRVRDRLTRIGAAITLDISFSQIPRYQAPILITSFSNLHIPYLSKTITGSFDASKLFRSATEMKGIAGYVGKVDLKDKYGVEFMDEKTILRDLCDYRPDELADPNDTSDCIEAITIGKPLQRIAISILPRIDVKVLSPFDLAKYGTTFISPPNRAGNSLYTVTLNWDLRSLIPSTAARLDALNSLKSMHSPEPNSPTSDQAKDSLWKRQVASLYIELRITPERASDPRWWDTFERTILRAN